NSNFITSKNAQIAIVEADEYDRSFLTLTPTTAVITSIDADHLDIYGGKEQLVASFQQFANQITADGTLVIQEKIASEIQHPQKITYGFSRKADYYAENIHIFPNKIIFDLVINSDPENLVFSKIELGITGKYNLLNALGTIAAINETYKNGKSTIILESDLLWKTIAQKLSTFSGVKRRFDYRIYTDKMVFVDDYAHHPEEINSFLSSLRTLFPEQEITGIFQPHLYSRTRDFAEEFAHSLELLDRIILLDIYPAREVPIEGITSSWLLSLIHKKNKIVLSKEALLPYLIEHKPQVLATLGAGDIDRLVAQIEQLFS
ncbi:MAG: UDP-N-acetylmuramate--L-alanine ligase, partial [Bacteroidales bacterium]|nr:UDP-N-acetylmuramate--L-alanine ligase [Bacteroidales bacterium]